MNFEVALVWLKDGKRCAREAWIAKGEWLKLQKPDENSLMTVPYIYMKTKQSELVPWVASQCDILANDWFLIKEF